MQLIVGGDVMADGFDGKPVARDEVATSMTVYVVSAMRFCDDNVTRDEGGRMRREGTRLKKPRVFLVKRDAQAFRDDLIITGTANVARMDAMQVMRGMYTG
jgi:hypothetical protein